MSKRLVVTPNIEEVNSLVEGKGWSKAYFSETVMKKSRGWITEWKRAKNFPSPEEAVHMCAMLQTTPEEILTEQADIELVRGLLEQEREKGIKKDPIPKDEAEDSETAELREIWSSADENERRDLLEMARMLKNRRKQNG
ncbi:hypothetical protein [Dysosmobacter sp.]|uniref:hypothetical protein n=1 Tax=Dysosmobacter sp. TaxID=2591382 RepID=UPI003A931B5B